MIPYKSIESVERIETPISTRMENALGEWYEMYRGTPAWLTSHEGMKSMNLPSMISREMARQVTLEMKWNISAKDDKGNNVNEETGERIENPRSEYLKNEAEKLFRSLRAQFEKGCASGGLIIKPYVKGEHIGFDFTPDWACYPAAFDDEGNMTDIVFRDVYTEGSTVYTRLERHTLQENDAVKITQKAFRTTKVRGGNTETDILGAEISLTDVPMWADLEPETIIQNSGGHLFGWYKVAASNTIDPDSPLGESIYARAKDLIRDADEQYSRLMWEYEGSELAIDVDPTVLRPKPGASGKMEQPKLNERLFRAVDLNADESYHVFSPPIRDVSLLNGLNNILCRIEDVCGLARGTISETTAQAMTATQLKMLRQRTYATVADNQESLEQCLKDVIRVMDLYATLYNLAPEGEIDTSFEWDDSIITDNEQQAGERMTMLNAGIITKQEYRKWYLGETDAQAKAGIDAVNAEQMQALEQMQSLQLPSDAAP